MNNKIEIVVKYDMKLNAVGVTSSNLKKTAEFYTLLGFSFPIFEATEQHLEPITTEGSTRLMIDTVESFKELNTMDPIPGNHSSFALQYDSAAEIDQIIAKVKAADFTVTKEPWDAFWGQRYAIVADPDGYKVDLYAYL